MIDKSIDYRSIIMRCDKVDHTAFCEVSKNVKIQYFEQGMEEIWIDIQKSVGEFENFTDADIKDYFKQKFLSKPNELLKSCVFLKDLATGIYIGTCCAWKDKRENEVVPVLHWLAVRDGFENKNYARMLVTEVMKIFENSADGKSIYLHTQPSSYKATMIYSDFGFCVTRCDTFGTAENEFDDALDILKMHMQPKIFLKIQESVIE